VDDQVGMASILVGLDRQAMRVAHRPDGPSDVRRIDRERHPRSNGSLRLSFLNVCGAGGKGRVVEEDRSGWVQG
jgi:hypothetical protein